MLRRSSLRATVLALLQLLPASRRARVQHRLLRLKNYLLPQTARQVAIIQASGLWDEDWFLQQHPQFLGQRHTLKIFVRLGARQALNPHPLFDSAWYQAQNPDVAALGINPLYHYLLCGHREGRQPNALFNDHWYRDQNPDVSGFQATALQHYLHFGDAESRDAHPLLQTRWYREQQSDLHPHTTVLAHYLHCGERADTPPNPWFDPAYYRQHPSMADQPSLLAHFTHQGAAAGLNPSEQFNLHEYCEAHPEVADGGINPLIHFLRSGRQRQSDRKATHITANQWHALFGQLTAAEHRLLASQPTTASSARILLWHAPDHKPVIAAAPSASTAINYQFSDWNQAIDWTAFDAVVWSPSAQTIQEDALHLGLAWLQRQPTQPIYFDALYTTDEGEARLDFKPDWSPARHRQGHLRISLLMMSGQFGATEAPSPHTLAEENLQRWQPGHIPFIATQGAEVTPWMQPQAAPPTTQPLVSIIIPTRDQHTFLHNCIEGIRNNTRYPHWEIILIDNGSQEAGTLAYLRQLNGVTNITVKRWDQPFNYSELCNVGARLAQGELLCMLNNDIEITQPDWLDRLVDAAREDDCGAVGAMLLYPDGRIQSAGVLMGPGGVAANRFATVAPERVPAGELDHVHEVSAVAGACLVTRKDIYRQLGGLNQQELSVAFNDVDYCLRLRELGLYCRLEPDVQLVHHESVSLKDHSHGRSTDFAREVSWMQKRWASAIARDPFHNLNLSLSKFRPLTPYSGNRRAALWPILGINTGTAPSPASLHPPLRWYVDDNQTRAAEVRNSNRAVQLGEPGRRPGLAVLILTKNRPEYIVPLVRALIAAEPAFAARELELSILIGDTGSDDPAVLELYRTLPACCQLISGLNYQFSRCNNQLLEQVQDLDTVLFLNNDITFDNAADTLLQLHETVHAKPDIGIVGALLQFPDGTAQHQGIAAFEQGPLRGFVHHPGTHAKTTLEPGQQQTCLAVTGALLMIRSDVLQVTGGFDENYAAECQDVDLCLAAARGGYASVIQHAGRIIHFENGTREIGEENWADRRRLMRRWHNWIEAHWL